MGTKNMEEIFPLEKVINFLERISDCFIIGLEQPGAICTQHYQIGVVLREDAKIADDLKRKLINYVDENLEVPLDPEEWKCAIECKYHNRIKYLFGYCSKDAVIYKKGISEEFLQECKDIYNSDKPSERKIPVSRSRLLPLIREMYNELWSKLTTDNDKMDKYNIMDNCKKFSVLEKMLIIRGYDLTCIAPSNKREIINNFDEYIVGDAENHLTDLDLIK